jgi:uncharacterized membrane protein
MSDSNNPYAAPNTPASPPPLQERDLSSEKNTLHILYILHAIAPFTMYILAIVAMIVGAVKHDDVRGTWLDSHYQWLSRTFWFGVLWWILAWAVFWVLGALTLGIGMLFLWILPVGVFLWYLYRCIIGWVKLNDNKTIGT